MSARLNDGNSGVRVWYSGALSSGAFTVTAKMRLASAPTADFTPLIVLENTSDAQSFLGINTDRTTGRITYNWSTASANVATVASGVWVDVAIVGSGTTLRGHIGTSNQSVTQAVWSLRQIGFGCNFSYGSNQTLVADVRIFNSALSVAQVNAEFASATPVNTGSLIGDFPLTSAYAARYAASGFPDTAAAFNASGTASVSFVSTSPSYAPVSPAGPAPTITLASATILGNKITASGAFTSAGTPAIAVTGYGPSTAGPVTATISGSSWSAVLTETAPSTSSSPITVTAVASDSNGTAQATSAGFHAAGFAGTYYVPTYYNPSSLMITPSSIDVTTGASQTFTVTDDSGIVADGVSLAYSIPQVASNSTGPTGQFTLAPITGTGTLTITASAVVPQASGTRTVTGTATVRITGATAPKITTTTVPDAVTGLAYSVGIDAENATGMVLASGPAWLTVTQVGAGWVLSGTAPSTAGSVTVVLTASNGSGTGSAELRFNVAAAAATLRPLRSGTVGDPYSYYIGDGGSTFTATGLPPGLHLSSTGQITGTPTAEGSYSITVNATLPGGAVVVITYTLQIEPAAAKYSPVIIPEVVTNKYVDLITSSHK